MAKVIKDTPDDPVGYLIKVLKKLYSEGSKVIVISVCSKNYHMYSLDIIL